MEVNLRFHQLLAVQNPELISILMIQAFYNVGTKRYSIIKSYYGTGGDLNVDEIRPHDRRMVYGIRKKELMVTSNLLKPTRLIELVNYVWLR
jgi:hypothetical protein